VLTAKHHNNGIREKYPPDASLEGPLRVKGCLRSQRGFGQLTSRKRASRRCGLRSATGHKRNGRSASSRNAVVGWWESMGMIRDPQST